MKIKEKKVMKKFEKVKEREEKKKEEKLRNKKCERQRQWMPLDWYRQPLFIT